METKHYSIILKHCFRLANQCISLVESAVETYTKLYRGELVIGCRLIIHLISAARWIMLCICLNILSLRDDSWPRSDWHKRAWIRGISHDACCSSQQTPLKRNFSSRSCGGHSVYTFLFPVFGSLEGYGASRSSNVYTFHKHGKSAGVFVTTAGAGLQVDNLDMSDILEPVRKRILHTSSGLAGVSIMDCKTRRQSRCSVRIWCCWHKRLWFLLLHDLGHGNPHHPPHCVPMFPYKANIHGVKFAGIIKYDGTIASYSFLGTIISVQAIKEVRFDVLNQILPYLVWSFAADGPVDCVTPLLAFSEVV